MAALARCLALDLPSLETLLLDRNVIGEVDAWALHKALQSASCTPKLRQLDLRWQNPPGGLSGSASDGLRYLAMVAREGALQLSL